MTKPALVAPLLACAGRDRQQRGGESTTLLAPGRRSGPLRRSAGLRPRPRRMRPRRRWLRTIAMEPIRQYYLLLGAPHESPVCAPRRNASYVA